MQVVRGCNQYCRFCSNPASGYMLDLEIRNELRRLQMKWPVTTVVTQALVGLDDVAFQTPAHPIGPHLSEWRARTLMKSGGVHMVGDTSHDMEMARAAGVDGLAVTYGAHREDRLRACGPRGCVASVEALERWLKYNG